MKKSVTGAIIKDAIVIALFAGIAAVMEADKTDIFCLMGIFGVFYGWGFASKIITAVTLQGIAIKAAISALFGFVIFPVTVVRDVILFAKYLINGTAKNGRKTHTSKQRYVEGKRAYRSVQ